MAIVPCLDECDPGKKSYRVRDTPGIILGTTNERLLAIKERERNNVEPTWYEYKDILRDRDKRTAEKRAAGDLKRLGKEKVLDQSTEPADDQVKEPGGKHSAAEVEYTGPAMLESPFATANVPMGMKEDTDYAQMGTHFGQSYRAVQDKRPCSDDGMLRRARQEGDVSRMYGDVKRKDHHRAHEAGEQTRQAQTNCFVNTRDCESPQLLPLRSFEVGLRYDKHRSELRMMDGKAVAQLLDSGNHYEDHFPLAPTPQALSTDWIVDSKPRSFEAYTKDRRESVHTDVHQDVWCTDPSKGGFAGFQRPHMRQDGNTLQNQKCNTDHEFYFFIKPPSRSMIKKSTLRPPKCNLWGGVIQKEVSDDPGNRANDPGNEIAGVRSTDMEVVRSRGPTYFWSKPKDHTMTREGEFAKFHKSSGKLSKQGALENPKQPGHMMLSDTGTIMRSRHPHLRDPHVDRREVEGYSLGTPRAISTEQLSCSSPDFISSKAAGIRADRHDVPFFWRKHLPKDGLNEKAMYDLAAVTSNQDLLVPDSRQAPKPTDGTMGRFEASHLADRAHCSPRQNGDELRSARSSRACSVASSSSPNRRQRAQSEERSGWGGWQKNLPQPNGQSAPMSSVWGPYERYNYTSAAGRDCFQEADAATACPSMSSRSSFRASMSGASSAREPVRCRSQDGSLATIGEKSGSGSGGLQTTMLRSASARGGGVATERCSAVGSAAASQRPRGCRQSQRASSARCSSAPSDATPPRCQPRRSTNRPRSTRPSDSSASSVTKRSVSSSGPASMTRFACEPGDTAARARGSMAPQHFRNSTTESLGGVDHSSPRRAPKTVAAASAPSTVIDDEPYWRSARNARGSHTTASSSNTSGGHTLRRNSGSRSAPDMAGSENASNRRSRHAHARPLAEKGEGSRSSTSRRGSSGGGSRPTSGGGSRPTGKRK